MKSMQLLSQVSRWLAGVCVVLALVALPGLLRADEPGNPSDCQLFCSSYLPGDPSGYTACVNNCLVGGQCPGMFNDFPPPRRYVGCVNPGARCYIVGQPSTCGDTPNKNDCTCLFVPQ